MNAQRYSTAYRSRRYYSTFFLHPIMRKVYSLFLNIPFWNVNIDWHNQQCTILETLFFSTGCYAIRNNKHTISNVQCVHTTYPYNVTACCVHGNCSGFQFLLWLRNRKPSRQSLPLCSFQHE